MDLRCIQRAEIQPECSILVLFGSWWGYLGVAMCFPMFPDQFMVVKVVRFEFQQKKSFLGLHTVVNWPYFGGVKGGGSDTNFFGLSIQFPHQLGPNDGKSSGPGRYLTFDTFWATLTLWSPCMESATSLLLTILLYLFFKLLSGEALEWDV